VAATVVNGGRMVAPVLIDRVSDADGRTRYKSRVTDLNRAISPAAAAAVVQMMRGTVESGTCRKAFRNADSDPVLSRLDIGGKTGSINSRTHEGRRYDWFVGFAGPREGTEPQHRVVLSVMVAHEKYIGTRSREYAREVIRHYFGHHFTWTDLHPRRAPADKARG
jgi:membrane peptidoglycan carboxypeptidase